MRNLQLTSNIGARVGACLSLALLATTAAGQPRIQFNLPSGGTQDVCIETGSNVTIQGGQTFQEVEAAANDLLNSCAGSGSGLEMPDTLDLATNNCDTTGDGKDDSVCLFVDWDVSDMGFSECTLEQIVPSTPPEMDPFEIENPGDNGGDCCDFPSFDPDVSLLAWPTNPVERTVGDKTFRLRCLPGPTDFTQTVTFTDATQEQVTIDSFNIEETSAAPGETINFQWMLTLKNDPPMPECTLSSDINGVIDDVTIDAAANTDDSDTVAILNDSPTGTQGFTFACTTDGMNQTDDDTDQVTIETDTACPPPDQVETRDTGLTQFATVFGNWPGGTDAEITVNTGEYMALEFTMSAAGSTGELSWLQANSNIGNLLASLDRCPGVFDTDDPGCTLGTPRLKGSISWAGGSPDPNTATTCELEPGQTHFLNLHFPNCGGSVCTSLIDNIF